MRLKQNKLKEITGLSQSSAQARWFKDHFGINVPCDRLGPIITQAVFEKLVERKCGLEPASTAKPQLKLKRKEK
jgi:Asp/Glu/hydantoin racemase